MSNIITINNFSETNRSKTIGNSLYRICKDQDENWLIHEAYSDKSNETWAGYNAHHNKDLQKVLDIFNAITAEKEIVNLMS